MVAAVVVGLMIALSPLVVQPVRVASSSMTPTVRSGDHLLVDSLAYRGKDPERGDIVVFVRDGQRLLKRIAALAGDEVGIEDGQLVLNGSVVIESVVDPRTVDGSYFGPVRVPAGTVFLLGDNRAESIDSRTFGPVPLASLEGRVAVRLWPSPGALRGP